MFNDPMMKSDFGLSYILSAFMKCFDGDPQSDVVPPDQPEFVDIGLSHVPQVTEGQDSLGLQTFMCVLGYIMCQ